MMSDENKEILEKIGEAIKKERERKNLSLRQLAKKIGVSHMVISQWENGLQEIGAINLFKISDELGIKIIQFSKMAKNAKSKFTEHK